MATIYKADGTVIHNVKPATGIHFQLEELQAVVGGYIELVYTRDGDEMYLNEEGKLNDLPINEAACKLYPNYPSDVVVGDVLVCKQSETAKS